MKFLVSCLRFLSNKKKMVLTERAIMYGTGNFPIVKDTQQYSHNLNSVKNLLLKDGKKEKKIQF